MDKGKFETALGDLFLMLKQWDVHMNTGSHAMFIESSIMAMMREIIKQHDLPPKEGGACLLAPSGEESRYEMAVATIADLVDHIEKHQRTDQHNPYTARELWPSLFARADAFRALKIDK